MGWWSRNRAKIPSTDEPSLIRPAALPVPRRMSTDDDSSGASERPPFIPLHFIRNVQIDIAMDEWRRGSRRRRGEMMVRRNRCGKD